MKTLYIECNMGVAGDMLMGALYELCDQKEKFLSDMNQAFAPYGVTLSVEPAVKCGIIPMMFCLSTFMKMGT